MEDLSLRPSQPSNTQKKVLYYNGSLVGKLGKQTEMAAAAATRTRIHVAGLGQSVSSDDLQKVFSAVGTVEGMDIIRTKGRSFAYVDVLPSSSNSLSKLFSTVGNLCKL